MRKGRLNEPVAEIAQRYGAASPRNIAAQIKRWRARLDAV
jgi:hypothetical protein